MAVKKKITRVPVRRTAMGAMPALPVWALTLRCVMERQVKLKGEEIAGRAQALGALNQIQKILGSGKMPGDKLLQQSREGQQAAGRAAAQGGVWLRIASQMQRLLSLGEPDGDIVAAGAQLENVGRKWEAAIANGDARMGDYARWMNGLESLPTRDTANDVSARLLARGLMLEAIARGREIGQKKSAPASKLAGKRKSVRRKKKE